MLFFGTFSYLLDDRNRLTIPPPFRTALADGMYLSPGLDACIVIHTPEQFEQEVQALRNLPDELQYAREAKDFLFSQIAFDVPDRQSRISLDARMLAAKSIGKNVIVNGAADSLKVWDRERWEALAEERAAGHERAIAELGRMRSVQMGLAGAQ